MNALQNLIEQRKLAAMESTRRWVIAGVVLAAALAAYLWVA